MGSTYVCALVAYQATFIILYLLISSFSQQILFSFFSDSVCPIALYYPDVFLPVLNDTRTLHLSAGVGTGLTPLVYDGNTQLHGLGGLSGGGVGGEVGGSKSTRLHAKLLLARGWAWMTFAMIRDLIS